MRVRKAVITAAGRGTRMFPATRAIQKEMLPIIDQDGLVKPTIQMIVEECLASGIEEICIVVENGGGAAFRDHFRSITDDERKGFAGKAWAIAEADKLADMATRISYVEQPSPEGFGHAVLQAKDFAAGEPIVLLLGDHVYTTPDGVKPCIRQAIEAAEASGGSVTTVRYEPEASVGVTGIVKCDVPAGETPALSTALPILKLQEKPSIDDVQSLKTNGLPDQTYLGHFGIHVFTAEIFECLQALIDGNIRVKNEFQLTSGQEGLLERAKAGTAPVYSACILNGTRWDIGMPDEYLLTLAEFGRRGPYNNA